MITLWSIVNNWITTHDVSDRIVVLVKDLIAFRKRTLPMMTDDVVKGSKTVGSFMTVHYHNKGCYSFHNESIVRVLWTKYHNFLAIESLQELATHIPRLYC